MSKTLKEFREWLISKGYHEDFDEILKNVKLETYGNVDPETGKFIFSKCVTCKGPKLAHVPYKVNTKCSNEVELNNTEIQELEQFITGNVYFQFAKDIIDTSTKGTHCLLCDEVTSNRTQLKNHYVFIHKENLDLVEIGKCTGDIKNSEETINSFDSNKLMMDLMAQLTSVVVQQSSTNRNTTQTLTKAQPFPKWLNTQNYDSWHRQVLFWNNNSRYSPNQKWSEMIESLKGNKEIAGLASFVENILMNEVNENSETVVEDLLSKLDTRYKKTEMEKLQECLSLFRGFKSETDENAEKFEHRYQILRIKMKKENLLESDYWEKALALIFIEENTHLDESQKTEFIANIEKKSGADIEKWRSEKFHALKIAGKRSDSSIGVFYANNNRSRYDKFKNQSNFRSPSWNRKNDGSRPKDSSSDKFLNQRRSNSRESKEAKFKDVGNTRSRSESWKRRDLSLKKREESLIRKQKSLAGILELKCRNNSCLDKPPNVYFTSVENSISYNEETVVLSCDMSDSLLDVYITSETKDVTTMIVDSGCPKNIAGRDWLMSYIKDQQIELKDIKTSKTKLQFRFGPSRVYGSNECWMIPICMEQRTGDRIIVQIEVYLVEAELPLLLSKEQLKKWDAAIGYRDGVANLIASTPKMTIELIETVEKHWGIRLLRRQHMDVDDVIYFIEEEKQKVGEKFQDITESTNIKRIHRVTGHKSEKQLHHAFEKAGLLSKDVKKRITNIVKNCRVCLKNKKSQSHPKVALPIVTRFNQRVTFDLKELRGHGFILWTVDSFTRLIWGEFIHDKEADTVLKALVNGWCHTFGYPQDGFYSDNGTEFTNKNLEELASKLNLTLKFSPTYAPWSNGLNERNHYSADITVKKVKEDHPDWLWKDIIHTASWTHNTNVSVKGFSPLQLVTGIGVKIPGITCGNLATESLSDADSVNKLIDSQKEITKIFQEIEYGSKLKHASKQRVENYNDIKYTQGDEIFYQKEGKNAWRGPVKVFKQEGRSLFIEANGQIKKVSTCHVRPHLTYIDDICDDTSAANNQKDKPNYTVEEDCLKSSDLNKDVETNSRMEKQQEFQECIEEDHLEHEIRPKRGRIVKCILNSGEEIIAKVNMVHKPNSLSCNICILKLANGRNIEVDFEKDMKKWNYLVKSSLPEQVTEDKSKDTVGVYWMQLEREECLCEEFTVYAVEVPTCRHRELAVIEAKAIEMKNLETYGAFKEVTDDGQQSIGSRWVVTEKEGHDGLETKMKARLVACGYQEELKPISDAPTISRESFKTFIAAASQTKFEICSLDVSAAFLQSDVLKREIYVKPPVDLRKEGILWRLLKPIYGLEDASRKFYLKVNKILKEAGFKVMEGDGSFYYMHDNNELKCMIIVHVDDFCIAGIPEYVSKMIELVKESFTVSKIEYGKFRFTGIDIERTENGIEINMEEYAKSINQISEIRCVKNEELLTKIEMKIFRKLTGKIQWLGENVRADLAIVALNMSRKNKEATIGDLKRINKFIEKIRLMESKIIYKKIGKPEDLKIFGLSDASYSAHEKSVGGIIILLGNKNTNDVVPIFWKTKTIRESCHSAKDAETRNLVNTMEESIYLGRQLETLFYGNIAKQIPVKIYTDSKPTLDSIASSKQIDRRLMRHFITDLKEKLEERSIESFSWLESQEILADIMTKERLDHPALYKLMVNGEFEFARSNRNLVHFKDDEFRMENITLKSKNLAV